ncbi:MerR family transcriptional regulator [Mycolicibacterium conceptionense]|uniref:MerR family transcriptional regulator n=1 Tax=Mycolicibacterium conceptionense TaxID=451644 RepID=UPI00096F26D4|nr:MerR family transcriptional regulator [Mycolicibacterium conceptionense]OMB81059.1 MerR family transcriptional regulator [Mycolicibacterium conceptionense]
MKISELEESTGVGRHALRYYERQGLLGEVQRTGGNYRDYPESLVKQVKLLRSMQALGFSLSEIRQVLDGLRASDIDCLVGARLLAEKRQRIEEHIRDLRQVSRTLRLEQERLERRALRHGKTLD